MKLTQGTGIVSPKFVHISNKMKLTQGTGRTNVLVGPVEDHMAYYKDQIR
jgi:hypothetical protein